MGRAVSAMVWKVWKVAPSPPWSEKLRRLRLGRKELILDRIVSAMIWKVAPSPPWSEKSHHLRLGLESRALSALAWKILPYPPWFGPSHSDCLSRAASIAVANNCFLVAPSSPRSGKSHRLRSKFTKF